MKFKILITSFLFTLSLFSCTKEKENQESGQKSEEPGQSTTAAVKSVKMWKAVVDDLRVREKPELNGKVILKVPYGTLMDDLNDKTPYETEVELQGVKTKAPWIKIRTRQGQEGWVHGAAVVICDVYTSLYQTTPQDTMMVTPFNQALSKLPLDQPESMGKAVEEWVSFTNGKPVTVADFAMIKLMEFGRKITDTSWEWKQLKDFSESENKGLWVEKPEWHANMDYNDYTRNLARNGLVLDSEEGMTFVQTDPAFLLRKAGDRVSPAMKAYLALEEDEVKKRVAGDGGLTVSAKELARRTVEWEKFNRQYPGFTGFLISENYFRWGLCTLITGLDNTPAFNYDDQLLNDEFKEAYEWVIANHPDTKTGKAVKEIYDILKREGMKSGPEHQKSSKKLQATYGNLEIL
ncbi:MAG: SH3 domain-containing protein [Bacteroidia bacterium]|nr:SH3 domain-containing protein [Bacteroidia bacterium]